MWFNLYCLDGVHPHNVWHFIPFPTYLLTYNAPSVLLQKFRSILQTEKTDFPKKYWRKFLCILSTRFQQVSPAERITLEIIETQNNYNNIYNKMKTIQRDKVASKGVVTRIYEVTNFPTTTTLVQSSSLIALIKK